MNRSVQTNRRRMRGFVALKSTQWMKTGATRTILMAAEPMRAAGVDLRFVGVGSPRYTPAFLSAVVHGAADFVMFNGLGSLTGRGALGYLLWSVARLQKIPVFLYWHETDWVLDRLYRDHQADARRVERVACHPATRHLAASSACADVVRRRFPPAQPLNLYECAHIPAPFDEPALPATPPTVVNIASIQERKGADLFVESAIEVCRRHDGVEFLWLGDGQDYGHWRHDIEAAGLQHRILFPGFVEAPYLLLRRASLLFLSSRDDPFPLSVLEAMALARSVVVFDTGGAPEALAGHGYVIPPFDTSAAAGAILDLLARPPAERLTPPLRERYLAHYTPHHFAARLTAILREQVTHAD